MCKFLSAIYLRTGKLICEPEYTDSHTALMAAHVIVERETDASVQQFVRLELTPPNKFSLDLESWNECVDEREVPEWFDKAARFDAFEAMREVVERSIVVSDREMLLGGFWIISASVTVKIAQNCRIYAAMDNSEIGVLRGNSKVGELRGNSKIGVLRDNSKVGILRDNSKVGVLWGNSKIGVLQDNSKVVVLCGNSKVGEIQDNSKVGELQYNSEIDVLRDNSKVGVLRDNSKVGAMWDDSKIGELQDNSKIGELWDDSNIGEDHRHK